MLIQYFKLIVKVADAGGAEVFHWQSNSLCENVRSTLAELFYTWNSRYPLRERGRLISDQAVSGY